MLQVLGLGGFGPFVTRVWGFGLEVEGWKVRVPPTIHRSPMSYGSAKAQSRVIYHRHIEVAAEAKGKLRFGAADALRVRGLRGECQGRQGLVQVLGFRV